MKAPPRRKAAPAFFTSWATKVICSSVSTEQGPAMRAKCPPPMAAGPAWMTESSGWNFRLTALKGSDTRVTDSTMSRLWIISMSTLAVLPMRPRTVWYSPLETWTPKFCSSSQWMRCWVRSGEAPGFKTAIIRHNSFLGLPHAALLDGACKIKTPHRWKSVWRG